jgi:5'-phosphate synthase pdxT subunit
MASVSAQITIGILALQGDFAAHASVCAKLEGVHVKFVRTPQDLDQVDSLILPGGESTTIVKLLGRFGLLAPLRSRIKQGMPAFGTCAGMILLSSGVSGMPEQPTLSVMDIVVERNAFGRQLDSFETDLDVTIPDAGGETMRAVFIRAPYVVSAGESVDILARYHDRIVAVKQGAVLAIAFHPEIAEDDRLHRYFAELTRTSTEQR